MAKRRYRKHASLEDILSRKEAGKARKKVKRKRAKKRRKLSSPTFVRFFEQNTEQLETATQVRRRTEKLFGESPEKLAIDKYRQRLHEQMLSNIPEGTEDSELLEAEAFSKAKLEAEEDQEKERKAENLRKRLKHCGGESKKEMHRGSIPDRIFGIDRIGLSFR